MLFIFLLSLGGMFWGAHIIFQYLPMVIASLYALILAPGAYGGGSEISKEVIVEKIEDKWFYAEDIANFITKYWYSIKFAMSAQKRGGNASGIAGFSLILAGYFYYKDIGVQFIIWSAVNGVLLGAIGNRVNKALFLIRHFPDNDQAKLACASFIALSEILENENFNFIVSEFIPRETFTDTIMSYSKVAEEYIES